MCNWQPIETAPKDEWIIGYDPSLLDVCFAIWSDDGSGWYADAPSQDGMGYYSRPLTHWMPMLKAPK